MNGAVTASDWLLAGATVLAVLVGVLAEAWITRRRDERHQLEEAVTELSMLLPHLMVVISDTWEGSRDTGLGSLWSERRARLTELTVRIRRLADSRWRWRRRVAPEVDDLAPRVIVAELDYLDRGLLVPSSALLSVTTERLSTAVFGSAGRPPLDAEIDYFRTHGVSASSPGEGASARRTRGENSP